MTGMNMERLFFNLVELLQSKYFIRKIKLQKNNTFISHIKYISSIFSGLNDQVQSNSLKLLSLNLN